MLAQYPSGQVFEFQGRELTQHDGWPPRLTGVSARAREAQTLGVYGGDLFVSVWPWAELWRYVRDADRWDSHGRMFTHPETTSRRTHPYEPEADRLGLVTNHWGRRVTGLIPLGGKLNGFDTTRLAEAKVTLGEGIYGRFSGTITNGEE